MKRGDDKAARPTRSARYFEEAYGAYQGAERSLGGIDRHYRVAGRHVRLRFAGDALEPHITAALAHLESERISEPSLTVCLWDDESTGTSIPAPPWLDDDDLEEERRGGWRTGIRPVVYGTDRQFEGIYEPRSGHLSLVDTARGLALYRVCSASAVPLNDRSVPLRAILHWWGRHQGLQLVHGAAVGTEEFGVLLVGSGGSGKSTTALAALDSGLLYVGDDYVMVEHGPPAEAHSLYSSGKLYPRDVQRVPHFDTAPRVSGNEDQEKEILLLHEHVPERLARKLPLRAILVLRVTGRRETSLISISVARCLAALAPSTLIQLPGTGEEDLHRLTGLVGRVPNYLLELGTDVAGVQRAIGDLVRGG